MTGSSCRAKQHQLLKCKSVPHKLHCFFKWRNFQTTFNHGCWSSSHSKMMWKLSSNYAETILHLPGTPHQPKLQPLSTIYLLKLWAMSRANKSGPDWWIETMFTGESGPAFLNPALEEPWDGLLACLSGDPSELQPGNATPRQWCWCWCPNELDPASTSPPTGASCAPATVSAHETKSCPHHNVPHRCPLLQVILLPPPECQGHSQDTMMAWERV